MLEEALPVAIGVGAALLPALAFGGLAAARAFMYLGAAEAGVLQPKKDSKEEGVKLIAGGAVATPIERRASLFKAFSAAAPAAPQPSASAVEASAPRAPFFGFAARSLQ